MAIRNTRSVWCCPGVGGHWIAISLNSRSFCCCQHHNTRNTNLIDGPSDDAVKRGRGFWLQACGRSPACFKVVSPPAQSLRVHQKSVLNVLWCWTLDIAKELVQMTQHYAQHLAGWCCDHAGILHLRLGYIARSRAQYLRRTKFVVLNLWAELRARKVAISVWERRLRRRVCRLWRRWLW